MPTSLYTLTATATTTFAGTTYTARQVAGYISSTMRGITYLINCGGDAFTGQGPQPTICRAIAAWEAGDLRNALRLARVASRLVSIRLEALAAAEEEAALAA